MILPIDALLRREVEAHRLRFTCETCAHFDEEAGRCSLGFPHRDHLRATFDDGTAIAFCKAYELA